MTPFLTKVRQFTGWALIIVSTVLMFVSIFVATTGELLKGGGIYVASQLTWYPGLALLGPEIIQKSKDLWNNFVDKIRGHKKNDLHQNTNTKGNMRHR